MLTFAGDQIIYVAHSQADPEPLAATQWAVVITVFGAAVVASMQIGRPAPALSLIRDDLGINMVMAGWVSSIFNVTGALIGIAAGLIADRLGYRRIAISGLLCLIGGTVISAITPSATVLLVARFFEGLGLISIMVAGTPLIVAASRLHDRGLVIGIWSTFFPLGGGLVLAAAAGILDTSGWRLFFGLNAVLCLAVLILFVRVVAPGRVSIEAKDPVKLRDAEQALRRAGPWLLAAAFLELSIATLAVQIWLPTFLLERLGLSIAEAALATAAFIFLFIPANFAGSRLIGVGPIRRWHMMAVGSVGIAFVPFGLFSDGISESLRAAIGCLYPLTAGLIPGAVFEGIPLHARSENQIGLVAGVVTQGAFLGNLVGPPLFAFLVVRLGGWDSAVWMFPVLGAIGLAIAFGFRSLEASR